MESIAQVETIEILVWAGVGLLVAVAVYHMIQAQYTGQRLRQYLAEHHREQWERLFYHQQIKKALLWPFMRGTLVDFIWKSEENFGDPLVSELRRKVRQSFMLTVASMIAPAVWFLIGALVLAAID